MICFQRWGWSIIITLNNDSRSPVKLQTKLQRWKKQEAHLATSKPFIWTWWCDFILKKYCNKKKMCPFIFSIPKAWNIGERKNNADTFCLSFFLLARAFIPSGVWLKSPTAPGSKHYYMALCLAFSSQMGIWEEGGGWGVGWGVVGLTSETDRISEPRMIQGSPLKINRQTDLHWSRLFISASLGTRPLISASFCTKSSTSSTIRSHWSRTVWEEDIWNRSCFLSLLIIL